MRAGKGAGTNADRGILGCHIHSDGRYCDKLYVDGGPSTTKTVGHLRMEGREVFKHAVINIAAVMDEAITKAGLKPMDIDWFVPTRPIAVFWKVLPKNWAFQKTA